MRERHRRRSSSSVSSSFSSPRRHRDRRERSSSSHSSSSFSTICSSLFSHRSLYVPGSIRSGSDSPYRRRGRERNRSRSRSTSRSDRSSSYFSVDSDRGSRDFQPRAKRARVEPPTEDDGFLFNVKLKRMDKLPIGVSGGSSGVSLRSYFFEATLKMYGIEVEPLDETFAPKILRIKPKSRAFHDGRIHPLSGSDYLKAVFGHKIEDVCTDLSVFREVRRSFKTEDLQLQIFRPKKLYQKHVFGNRVGDRMFLSPDYADIVFKVGNVQFPAHKIVVCTQSPVIKAMLSHETIEGRTNVVKIKDFSPDGFKTFLRYLYTGDPIVKPLDDYKSILDLAHAADMYDVTGLKNACELQLDLVLNPKNAIPMLIAAHERTFTGSEVIIKKILNFTTQWSEEIINSGAWESLREYPGLIMQMYEALSKSAKEAQEYIREKSF